MSTFHERLSMALGGPYEDVMRRSVQAAILYESHRTLESQIPSLRPFQKKIAIYDQATHLLETMPGLRQKQREEIFWRTGTSREPLNPETMWRRARAVVVDVAKLADQIDELYRLLNPRVDHVTHHSVYVRYIQKQYSDLNNTNTQYPRRFEFTHNNSLVAYKMYYNKGKQLDATFPKPVHCGITIPIVKPEGGVINYSNGSMGGSGSTAAASSGANAPAGGGGGGGDGGGRPEQQLRQHRMDTLKEVREHLDLLKEFEGVVDSTVINERKHALFLALPPAPPPHPTSNNNNKKQKTTPATGATNNQEDDDRGDDGSERKGIPGTNR
jgi:hypothetical protein